MTCDELSQLLPDLLDSTLNSPVFEEAMQALAECPECQKELEAAGRVQELLVKLRATNIELQTSPDFLVKLLIRIHLHDHDLSNL